MNHARPMAARLIIKLLNMIWQAHLFSDHFMLQNKGLTKLENYGHIKNHCDTAHDHFV